MQWFCVRGRSGAACLTVRPDPGAPSGTNAAEKAYEQVRDQLQRHGLIILQERVFGSLSSSEAIARARARVLADTGLDDGSPTTFIEGQPVWGGGLAGVQIFACRPAATEAVEVLQSEGRPVGRIWHRAAYDMVFLSDMRADASHARASRAEQAAEMFRRTEHALANIDLPFRDVVRTWIYLDDILAWYGPFNEARTGQFRRMGLLDGTARAWMPASTGIEGSNPGGLGCTMDVLAIRVRDPKAVQLRTMHNPRQNEAFAYGSAFARGMYIDESQGGQIFVSGTAAIDDEGRTVCRDDARGQIDYTLANIEELLQQADATPADICQATVFFQKAAYRELYRSVADARGWPHIPAVHVRADVCRPDLLFEIDALALRPGTLDVSSPDLARSR